MQVLRDKRSPIFLSCCNKHKIHMSHFYQLIIHKLFKNLAG